jgi:hypothetical protein
VHHTINQSIMRQSEIDENNLCLIQSINMRQSELEEKTLFKMQSINQSIMGQSELDVHNLCTIQSIYQYEAVNGNNQSINQSIMQKVN